MYIKTQDGETVQYYGPSIGRAAMTADGWIWYDGNEPVDRLQINEDGSVTVSPESVTPFNPYNFYYSRYGIVSALDKAGLWDSIYSQLTDKQKLYLNIANDFSLRDALFKSVYDSLSAQYPEMDTILQDNILGAFAEPFIEEQLS